MAKFCSARSKTIPQLPWQNCALPFSQRWNHYRIRVTEKDLKAHEALFRDLIKMAREHREG